MEISEEFINVYIKPRAAWFFLPRIVAFAQQQQSLVPHA